MKVTQGDIARELNLSVTTVSRALQNDPVINPQTRAEVLEMASRLNYQPRSNRVKNIADKNNHHYVGVLVKAPIKEDSWAPDQVAHGYLSGMSEVSLQFNTSLIVHHLNDDNVHDLTKPDLMPPFLRDNTVSGLILIHYFPPEVVKELSSRFPVVTIVHEVPDADNDHIDMDNSDSVINLVDHLYQNGHRKIGFMGYRSYMSWSQARLGGYLQAMVKLGLEIDQSLIRTETDVDFIIKKMKEGIRAWVFSVDRIGYAVYRELLDRGIRVPEDVSLCGFDGISPLLNCEQLTTLKAPLRQMGIAALHRLLLRIDEPLMQPIKILHRCEFVKGKSS